MKINSNKFMDNQQCNRHLPFPGQHYSFQRFFQTFPHLLSFSRVFKALKISTLNSTFMQLALKDWLNESKHAENAGEVEVSDDRKNCGRIPKVFISPSIGYLLCLDS